MYLKIFLRRYVHGCFRARMPTRRLIFPFAQCYQKKKKNGKTRTICMCTRIFRIKFARTGMRVDVWIYAHLCGIHIERVIFSSASLFL